jgi:hypothetical protein
VKSDRHSSLQKAIPTDGSKALQRNPEPPSRRWCSTWWRRTIFRSPHPHDRFGPEKRLTTRETPHAPRTAAWKLVLTRDQVTASLNGATTTSAFALGCAAVRYLRTPGIPRCSGSASTWETPRWVAQGYNRPCLSWLPNALRLHLADDLAVAPDFVSGLAAGC